MTHIIFLTIPSLVGNGSSASCVAAQTSEEGVGSLLALFRWSFNEERSCNRHWAPRLSHSSTRFVILTLTQSSSQLIARCDRYLFEFGPLPHRADGALQRMYCT